MEEKETEVGCQYQMSRNTVKRLCDLFRTTIPQEKQELLLTSPHVTQAHCAAYKVFFIQGLPPKNYAEPDWQLFDIYGVSCNNKKPIV